MGAVVGAGAVATGVVFAVTVADGAPTFLRTTGPVFALADATAVSIVAVDAVAEGSGEAAGAASVAATVGGALGATARGRFTHAIAPPPRTADATSKPTPTATKRRRAGGGLVAVQLRSVAPYMPASRIVGADSSESVRTAAGGSDLFEMNASGGTTTREIAAATSRP